MKALAIATFVLCIAVSFAFAAAKWPCHPYGDAVPCEHRVHAYDYDMYGNTFPCGHRLHTHDVVPCIHYCF